MAKASITFCFVMLFACIVACSGDWCVAKPGAPDAKMQQWIDFVCSQLYCGDILPGGDCYLPNDYYHHGTVCLNNYYKVHDVCNFEVGELTNTDPSFGTCNLPGMNVE